MDTIAHNPLTQCFVANGKRCKHLTTLDMDPLGSMWRPQRRTWHVLKDHRHIEDLCASLEASY